MSSTQDCSQAKKCKCRCADHEYAKNCGIIEMPIISGYWRPTITDLFHIASHLNNPGFRILRTALAHPARQSLYFMKTSSVNRYAGVLLPFSHMPTACFVSSMPGISAHNAWANCSSVRLCFVRLFLVISGIVICTWHPL